VGLRRADSLAVALEARGFARPGRRPSRALRAGAPDLAVCAALVALAGLVLMWR
jgi:energy-coupling factor transporter transmembrane protein EcfT